MCVRQHGWQHAVSMRAHVMRGCFRHPGRLLPCFHTPCERVRQQDRQHAFSMRAHVMRGRLRHPRLAIARPSHILHVCAPAWLAACFSACVFILRASASGTQTGYCAMPSHILHVCAPAWLAACFSACVFILCTGASGTRAGYIAMP